MSTHAGPDIVENGLIVYLDAASSKSFLGNGTTWIDLSGTGNNGTLVNGVEPIKRNSIAFDGNGDFLTLSGISSTYLSSDFCIEGWVYITSQQNHMFFNTIPHTSFGISLNRGGSGQTALYIGNGTAWQTLDFRSTGVLSPNQWHHIAVTRNSNTITIWHNGVNQGSTSAVVPTGAGTTAYIGTYNGSTGENLSGKIYGYRIVTGSPVYTSNFTPPTKALSIPGTQLIVGQDGGITNSAQTLVTVVASGNVVTQVADSMMFDGVDDYITCPKPTLTAFTLNFYCKLLSNAASGYPWIISVGSDFIGFTGTATSATFRASLNNGVYTEINSMALNPGTSFNMYSVVYNGSVVSLYVNGNLQPSTMMLSGFGLLSANSIRLGTNGSVDRAASLIGNVQLYNRALSANEVRQNFNASRSKYGI